MACTVTAFGREWSHRQFHGLLKQLVKPSYSVEFSSYGSWEHHAIIEDNKCFWTRFYCGYGPTPWVALCDAVEKMEMCEAKERMEK